jgi:hypothetical protein
MRRMGLQLTIWTVIIEGVSCSMSLRVPTMWTLEGGSEAATLYARAARETRVVVVESSFMVGGWVLGEDTRNSFQLMNERARGKGEAFYH